MTRHLSGIGDSVRVTLAVDAVLAQLLAALFCSELAGVWVVSSDVHARVDEEMMKPEPSNKRKSEHTKNKVEQKSAHAMLQRHIDLHECMPACKQILL